MRKAQEYQEILNWGYQVLICAVGVNIMEENISTMKRKAEANAR
jgi:hypothetical protein